MSMSQADKNINTFEMLKDIRDVLRKWNCIIECEPLTEHNMEFKCVQFNISLPIETRRTLKAKDIEKFLDEYYTNLKEEYEAVKKIVEGE
jgi:hypothetical protein